MTQQVLYDTATSLVLQWQDTDQYGYGAAPSTTSTLAVTATEWANQAGTWYVVSGALTQTNPNAPTAAQLLAAAQTAQNALLKQARNAAIQAIPVTINGTAYTIDNSPAQQTANLNLAMSMQVIVAQAPAWSTGESVAAGAYCNLGGVYLYCSTGGTTGTTAPTAPTAFGTPVTDGTAAWELLGRHVWLTDGTAILLTPQGVMAGAAQIEAYMSQQTFKLTGLLAQVAAATTVADVQAVVWG
ncbi:MAG: hypothetical protein ACYCS8_04085 [Acidithiobacillus sp.]